MNQLHNRRNSASLSSNHPDPHLWEGGAQTVVESEVIELVIILVIHMCENYKIYNTKIYNKKTYSSRDFLVCKQALYHQTIHLTCWNHKLNKIIIE